MADKELDGCQGCLVSVVAFVITGVILLCATDLDAASLILITFVITVAVRAIFGLIRKKKRKNNPGVIITKDYKIDDIPDDIPKTDTDDGAKTVSKTPVLPDPSSSESSISGKKDTEKTRICTQCGANKFKHKDGKVVCQYCESAYTPDNVISHHDDEDEEDDDDDWEEDYDPKETEGFTVSQRNAYRSAKSYLRLGLFSHDSLIRQLVMGDKYPTEDAEFAVDHLNADWYEQAYKCGKSFVKSYPFSQEGLIKQLKIEKFTDDQADYGAKKVFRDE